MRTPDRSIRPMRAAILQAHGGIPELGEFRDPEPAEGDEVVEILAAGMNPVDIRSASGAFALERHEPPYVAGKEGVGRREDGSLVYFEYSREPFGAFAERSLLATGDGYPLPDGLDPALAVCLGVSGLAAWLSLEWRAGLRRARPCSCSVPAASSARSAFRRRSCRRRARGRRGSERRGPGAGAAAGRRHRGRAR